MVYWLLHETIEAFRLVISELVFRNGRVRHDHEVFLVSTLYVAVCEFSDFCCGLDPVHSRHINIHDNKLICLLVPLDPLLALHNGFFSTDCLVSLDFVCGLEDHLQNSDVEDRVIHNQHLGDIALALYLLLPFATRFHLLFAVVIRLLLFRLPTQRHFQRAFGGVQLASHHSFASLELTSRALADFVDLTHVTVDLMNLLRTPLFYGGHLLLDTPQFLGSFGLFD